MTSIFKQIVFVLLLAGAYSASVAIAQQTGPVIVPRDRTSPSIHEGLSGVSSAGFKQNVNPLIGQVPASFDPWYSGVNAIGSLVLPRLIPAPFEDASTYGFKPTIQKMISKYYSQKGGATRLDAGFKGIAGKNVTDVAAQGQVCGSGPGDVYWVGFPRPANKEVPPAFQQPADPRDCACRCNEQIYCSTGFNPFIRYQFFGGLNPGPVPCQVCYGAANLGFNAIRKHDIYVGKDKGTHWGYPVSFPTDPGYLECLRQNPGDPSGGSPGNPLLYGL